MSKKKFLPQIQMDFAGERSRLKDYLRSVMEPDLYEENEVSQRVDTSEFGNMEIFLEFLMLVEEISPSQFKKAKNIFYGNHESSSEIPF